MINITHNITDKLIDIKIKHEETYPMIIYFSSLEKVYQEVIEVKITDDTNNYEMNLVGIFMRYENPSTDTHNYYYSCGMKKKFAPKTILEHDYFNKNIYIDPETHIVTINDNNYDYNTLFVIEDILDKIVKMKEDFSEHKEKGICVNAILKEHIEEDRYFLIPKEHENYMIKNPTNNKLEITKNGDDYFIKHNINLYVNHEIKITYIYNGEKEKSQKEIRNIYLKSQNKEIYEDNSFTIKKTAFKEIISEIIEIIKRDYIIIKENMNSIKIKLTYIPKGLSLRSIIFFKKEKYRVTKFFITNNCIIDCVMINDIELSYCNLLPKLNEKGIRDFGLCFSDVFFIDDNKLFIRNSLNILNELHFQVVT